MDYKTTLNLPKTSFPMKADLPQREPGIIARWQATDLYGQIRKARADAKRFILHDGPPYANGDIHIGHALNKILKDLIVRYKTMRGFDSPYVPGWDCHGMPIEHQLFKELKLTKQQIAQTAFREKARAYAQRYVDIQREQFKRLGVSGDWDHPYLTMAKDYELTILRIFRELVEAGDIYRGKKPVYWCATCETALAEAEVEYEYREDPSIYVKFEVPKEFVSRVLEKIPHGRGARVYFIIWTTTPWTLLANVAIALHPTQKYRCIEVKNDEWWIVAEERADWLLRYFKIQANQTKGPVRPGAHFTGVHYLRPFVSPLVQAATADDVFTEVHGRVVTDEFVSVVEGTGIVHIAPGHGQEDYVIGQRYKLDVLSPVDHQGKFTDEVPQFAGQLVFKANEEIIKWLDKDKKKLLVGEEPLTHSYPHCWRCKQPVIFRATPQWFLKVDAALRKRLLEAAGTVTWIPPVGLKRISGMLASRPDWCLSRQRYWGTPIPVFHCEACEQPLDDAASIRRIEEALQQRGIDAWFSTSPQELVPGLACPRCRGSRLRRDTDILDVWFDSGVSHEAVLKLRGDLGWPADLYLEGSDQHRGWFQVSLIPAVALRHQPPYRQVLTHGFVVDGEGRKMSKSLGNVVAPQDVMERYGADILRLWAASCDYREDVRISEEILSQLAETYRKLRNTFRYLLANLADFNPQRDTVHSGSDLPELDRWAMHRARELLNEVTAAYDAWQFHEVVRAMYQYCVLDLSGFYLDALKDRLYTETPSSSKRRCAQTALYAILHILVKALAPVLVATTEEAWQLMREAGWVSEPSVHLALWPTPPDVQLDETGRQRWATFRSMRDIVMKALEEERSKRVIGSPLEAQVTLLVNDQQLRQLCETHRDTLAEAFVVSDVAVQANGTPTDAADTAVPGLVGVKVERAPGGKCARCWKHLTSVGVVATHPQLCERCVRVILALSP